MIESDRLTLASRAPGPEVIPLQGLHLAFGVTGQKLDAVPIPSSLPNTSTQTISKTHVAAAHVVVRGPPARPSLCRALLFHWTHFLPGSGAERGLPGI